MSSSLSAPNLLFYIGRSLNKNVVVYCYNKSGKNLNSDTPLSAYWIMREKENNPTEELTFMESKMAFGFKILAIKIDLSIGVFNIEMIVLGCQRFAFRSWNLSVVVW